MNINSVAPPKIILTFCGTDKAGLWMGEHSVQREVANTINIQSWEHAHSTYDVEFGPEKMVFCYQNCSDLLWEKIVLVIEKKKLKFEAEGQEFSKILGSLEQFIQQVKGQNNFW